MLAPGVAFSDKDSTLTKNGAELRRNSTIYSKPSWPSEQHQDADHHKDHHYATIAEDKEKWDSGTYSYAYQHSLFQAQQSGKSAKGDKGLYQEMGTMDYMHMYSKPSPLLLSSERNASLPHREESGYTHLNSATLNTASVYTNTVQKPANLE